MKNILPICILFLGLLQTAFAQNNCGQLFISEYIEGSNNNKALEIYNPTTNAINLSGYSVGRFDNGSTQPSQGGPIQLPDVMLAPNDAFVVVLDRRSVSGTGVDLPVWNGLQVFVPAVDSISGMIRTRVCDGDTIFLVQYVNGDNTMPFQYETTYKAEYDLQGKADVFACPDYNVNRSMSFNGNDAVFLISGTTVAADGSNIIDVIGVIGENPDNTIGQPAWVDANGKWVTKDITIVRNSSIKKGTGIVAAILQDTLAYNEWTYYCEDDFSHLGSHTCDCHTNSLNEPVAEVAATIAPNPTSNNFVITAQEPMTFVQVYNTLGQLVKNNSLQTVTYHQTIDLSDLPKGIYVVNIGFDKKRTVRTVVKQ